MAITAALVKELREKTGAGMMVLNLYNQKQKYQKLKQKQKNILIK